VTKEIEVISSLGGGGRADNHPQSTEHLKEPGRGVRTLYEKKRTLGRSAGSRPINKEVVGVGRGTKMTGGRGKSTVETNGIEKTAGVIVRKMGLS